MGATIAREGAEFGVLRRSVAVGGQVLTLQGLGGVYDEVFVPLYVPGRSRVEARCLREFWDQHPGLLARMVAPGRLATVEQAAQEPAATRPLACARWPGSGS